MARTAEGRICKLTTTLGTDVLMLKSMSAVEGISQLFRMQMELVSHEGGIEFEQIVGKPVRVELELDGGTSRYFHGIVSRFWQGGAYHVDTADQGLVSYRADVVPWLWTLSRATNCRVFEDEIAPDIIRKIFEDLGYRENEDYEFSSLGESHEPIPYCVQYRETDFNFVSRLMEEQGLAYCFRHEAEKHTMVIFDTSASCPDCKGYETMLYGGLSGSATSEKVIEEWSTQQVMPPGKYALNGYDLENPSDDLLAPTQSALSMGGNAKYEIYDYPPYYTTSSDGSRYVRFRMEAEEAASHVIEGRGCCGAFTAGTHITLKGHFREAFNNKRYLITRVQHSIDQVVAQAGGGSSYENTFACLPERIPYRPMQKTPKPSIQGSQTAVVVGPSGEEIHCDLYGRIRIQFHWDRYGKSDGTDVCWARVAQSSAGKRWGTIFIPRIGQEVVVTFLDGDPDRPLVTGVVYNAEQMPPYELDANKTQSGWKTRSSKEGDPETYNEIKFEDKKGEELVSIHAERDMSTSVENDQSLSVGANRSVTITDDETVTIKKGKQVTTIEKNDQITTLNSGNQVVDVTGDASLTVTGGSRSVGVSGGDYTAEASANLGLKAGAAFSAEGTGSATVHSPGTVTISSDSQVVIVVGGSSITVTPGGIEVTAPMITSGASGQHSITGAIVKIN